MKCKITKKIPNRQKVTNIITNFAARNSIKAKIMRHLTTFILLLTSLFGYSQNNQIEGYSDIMDPPTRTILDNYLDSINIYKHRIDSLEKENSRLNHQWGEPLNRYSRLFTPITFYNDLAHRHFSLEEDDALTTDNQLLVDNALMNIYINHPEFVRGKMQIRTPKAENKKKDEKVVALNPAYEAYNVPKAEEINVDKIDLMIKKPNFWSLRGEFFLQMMQNYYSAKWYQGGESNYSALSRVTLWADYNNKQKVKFENKLEMHLGFMTNKSDTVHSVKTSSDLFRYTGKLGIQATKKWYYTLQVVANTQFMRTFASNSHTVNSDFMSPLNINASLGMDYNMSWFKKRLTGTVHLAPLSCNYKYVDRLALATRNGIDEGKHSKFDYGSTFQVDFNWKFSDNVNWRTRLYGYTTYHRMDLQWENTLNLKISKILTASVYVYPRFDDSSISRKDEKLGYFQLKEYTSFGLTYSF